VLIQDPQFLLERLRNVCKVFIFIVEYIIGIHLLLCTAYDIIRAPRNSILSCYFFGLLPHRRLQILELIDIYAADMSNFTNTDDWFANLVSRLDGRRNVRELVAEDLGVGVPNLLHAFQA
jgi:hypothetical protein